MPLEYPTQIGLSIHRLLPSDGIETKDNCETSFPARWKGRLAARSGTGYPHRGGTMTLLIEIRAAEGGDDAKMLVRDQVDIYKRRATRRGL